MTQDVSTRPARKIFTRFSKLLAVTVIATMLLFASRTPKPAYALFHISVIDEAMFGANGDPNIQFVEIKMLTGSQNFPAHSRLTAWSADGSTATVLFEVPGNLTYSGTDVRWIMGTAAYAAASGMTPDFIFPPATLPATGMICWGAPGVIPPNPPTWDAHDPLNYVDCIPYGGYAATPIRFGPATTLGLGDGTSSLTRMSHTDNASVDFALACPSPTNNYGGVGFNHDNHIDLPPTKFFDDLTWPNSDLIGDNCGDTDDDNDGIPDATETAGPPCASASAATNPLVGDTDGDRFLDGAECALGFDPASAASHPPLFPAGDTDHDGLTDAYEGMIGTNPLLPDTDGDKINDGLEVTGYNSNPLSTNTDGDACGDGREIGDLNGDGKVNSTDQTTVAQAFGTAPGPPYYVFYDINKDGKVNSTDQVIQNKVYNVSSCP